MDRVGLQFVQLVGVREEEKMKGWDRAKGSLLVVGFIAGIPLALIGGVCIVENVGLKDDWESTFLRLGIVALAAGAMLIVLVLPRRTSGENHEPPGPAPTRWRSVLAYSVGGLASIILAHQLLYRALLVPALPGLTRVPASWWVACGLPPLLLFLAAGCSLRARRGLFVMAGISSILITAYWSVVGALGEPPAHDYALSLSMIAWDLVLSTAVVLLALALGRGLGVALELALGRRARTGFLLLASISVAAILAAAAAAGPHTARHRLQGFSSATVQRVSGCGLGMTTRNHGFLTAVDLIVEQVVERETGCFEGTKASLLAEAYMVNADATTRPAWKMTVEADSGELRSAPSGDWYITKREGCCAAANLFTFFDARTGQKLFYANDERVLPLGREAVAFVSCDDPPVLIPDACVAGVHGVLSVASDRGPVQKYLVADSNPTADYASRGIEITEHNEVAVLTVSISDRGSETTEKSIRIPFSDGRLQVRHADMSPGVSIQAAGSTP